MEVSAILFDLDGVLVDSRDLHFEALNRALGEVVGARYQITLEEHLAKYDGCSTTTKLEMLSAKRGLPASSHQKIWEAKQKYTEELIRSTIRPSNTVAQLLRHLAERGYTLFCASNSVRATTHAFLKAMGIFDLFKAVYCNQDVRLCKPHPSIYLKCYVEHDLIPQQCLVVEDSPIGRTAAALSGAHVCAVSGPEQVTLQKINQAIQKACETNAGRHIDTRWLSDIQVVIPMAGEGSRFRVEGFDKPKPLIDVLGRPMIQWVVENLNVATSAFVFVVQKAHLDNPEWELRETLTALVPCCKIVAVERVTEGPACTVLLAEEHLDPNKPLLIANSDQYLEWDANAFMYQSKSVDGAISVFHQPDPTDKKWSYVSLDPCSGFVQETREKECISDLASTGVYYWSKAGDFMQYANQMIAKNARVNGEFYVCPIYNEAIAEGKKIKAIACHKMWGLGVPSDLDAFVKEKIVGLAETRTRKTGS